MSEQYAGPAPSITSDSIPTSELNPTGEPMDWPPKPTDENTKPAPPEDDPLVVFARKELTLAGAYQSDGYETMVADAVLELVRVFSKQGHSGMSASLTIQFFTRLADWKTICPLTGEPDEWNEISDDGERQNRRDSAVFQDKDGKAYYIDALIWRTPNGGCWNGSAWCEGRGKVRSSAYIQSFPFLPKTFTVDVTEDDTGDFIVKDPKQLEEAAKLYELEVR